MAYTVTGSTHDLFFQVNTSSSVYGSAPDVVPNSKFLQGFSLYLVSGGTVSWSVDGANEAGRLIASTTKQYVQFDNRRPGPFFFKVISGGAAVIQIEVW